MVFMMNKFPGLYLTVGWVLLQRLSAMSNSHLDVARGIAVFTSVKHGIKGMKRRVHQPGHSDILHAGQRSFTC